MEATTFDGLNGDVDDTDDAPKRQFLPFWGRFCENHIFVHGS